MNNSRNKDSIESFGKQFLIHGDLDEDYWTSDEMFRDHFPKDFDLNSITDRVVCEVGSGSGRIINMIARYKPKKIIAVEPSEALSKLVANTKNVSNLMIENVKGDKFKSTNIDIIFCLGVLHHIPDADSVVRHIYNQLKPGGIFVCWVYGKENQESYVFLQNVLRKITKVIPDFLLNYFSAFLALLLSINCILFKKFNYPMKRYFENNFMKCNFKMRKYIIFDQLNPTYSKYYSKNEIESLVLLAGFKILSTTHRHGYSWTLILTK
jgi:SAM-dependent methyltransferase